MLFITLLLALWSGEGRHRLGEPASPVHPAKPISAATASLEHHLSPELPPAPKSTHAVAKPKAWPKDARSKVRKPHPRFRLVVPDCVPTTHPPSPLPPHPQQLAPAPALTPASPTLKTVVPAKAHSPKVKAEPKPAPVTKAKAGSPKVKAGPKADPKAVHASSTPKVNAHPPKVKADAFTGQARPSTLASKTSNTFYWQGGELHGGNAARCSTSSMAQKLWSPLPHDGKVLFVGDSVTRHM